MPARSTWVGGTVGSHRRRRRAGDAAAYTSYVAVVDNEGNVFSATPSDGFSVPLVPGSGSWSRRGGAIVAGFGGAGLGQPGKRPRLTTNPFILFKDGKPVMPFGTPGADVQPQAMLQFVLNVTEFGMDPQEAAEAPRLSTYSFPLTSDPHPYNPNLLKVEERMGREALEGLAAKGHDVVAWPDWHPPAGWSADLDRPGEGDADGGGRPPAGGVRAGLVGTPTQPSFHAALVRCADVSEAPPSYAGEGLLFAPTLSELSL